MSYLAKIVSVVLFLWSLATNEALLMFYALRERVNRMIQDSSLP